MSATGSASTAGRRQTARRQEVALLALAPLGQVVVAAGLVFVR
ncbi:hypothetical protein [Haloarcula sp. 1CSR25-25]|nr:hypothetical protein [Haloarcula sp. 1CSR25-25]